MTPKMLFYKNAVPVSSEAHRDVSLSMTGDFSFARSANSVPLVAAEFRNAAQDSIIVFAGQGQDVMPAVVLGLKDEENAYVGESGAWGGRYIPAFIRRYPFIFSSADGNKTLTLCIDEACEGVNTDGVGEKLFDSQGDQTAYLKSVLDFTRDYQAQYVRTRAFCQRLVEHDLLEPMQVQYTMPDGAKGRLSGFLAVNRDKVKALPAEVIAEMLANDELEMLFVHLQSLNNLQSVIERCAAAATPAAEAEPA